MVSSSGFDPDSLSSNLNVPAKIYNKENERMKRKSKSTTKYRKLNAPMAQW